MTTTLELVAVISLGWIHLRKSVTLGTFGPQSLNIVIKRLKTTHSVISSIKKCAHPLNFSIQKCTPTLRRYTSSFPLELFPNGRLTLCIASLPQSGGMVIVLYVWNIFMKWAK